MAFTPFDVRRISFHISPVSKRLLPRVFPADNITKIYSPPFLCLSLTHRHVYTCTHKHTHVYILGTQNWERCEANRRSHVLLVIAAAAAAAAAKSLQSCPDSVRPHSQQPTRLLHSWDSPGKNTGVGCHFHLQCMHAC